MGLTTATITFFLLTSVSAFAFCPEWKTSKVGELDTQYVSEASGLAKSKLHPELFIWSNDSGAPETLYASKADGKIVRSVNLQNFPNYDYEAMAIASCPQNKTESCIFVADIGDNREARAEYRIGIFKEADFWNETSISPIQVVKYLYPHGNSNAESLIVTPEGQMIVFSKHKSGVSRILSIDIEGSVKELGTLDMKELAGLESWGALITDAAISPDGQKVLLLTYSDILEFNLSSLLAETRKPFVKGIDYTIIKGLPLEQQETITYTSQDTFIIATEVETGGTAELISYACHSEERSFYENN